MKEMQMHDTQRLEKQVNDVSNALAHLGDPEGWKELIIILKRPGWTTPAEFVFASAILESMNAHVAALATLRGKLMEGSKQVIAK